MLNDVLNELRFPRRRARSREPCELLELVRIHVLKKGRGQGGNPTLGIIPFHLSSDSHDGQRAFARSRKVGSIRLGTSDCPA